MQGASRTVALVVGLAMLVGCGGAREEKRSVATYTIEQFLGNTNTVGACFSPDNSKVLVSSDESGIFNAYAIPVDGSDPIQLTTSTTDGVFVRSYFPRDERFIYLSDTGGNELNHVYVRELDGSVTDITPGEELRALFLGWAHDEDSLFVATNERDKRFFDVYEVAEDTYERTLVYKDETGYDFGAISPDERFIAFSKSRTTYDSDVFLLDRSTGEMISITAHEGNVANAPAEFTPDSKALLLLTDSDNEFRYLLRYELQGGNTAVLAKPEWDVLFAGYSRNGKYLVTGVNKDARTEITVFDAATMAPQRLPEVPDAEISSVSLSRDETRLAFYASSSRSPSDLFTLDLGSGESKQLTRTLNPAIDPLDLVDGKVVRFASYDGVEIPGILYTPHAASASKPAPALVWVHGGPGGQSRVGYSGLLQYLVNHGYVVYAINNRGSSGYGKTFFTMDDRKHGEADLADCVASKAMLAGTGAADPGRIGIIGGSYGGYMVLAALAFTPEEFAVGVDIFGVANWVRTLESIPPWWESFREALYIELGDPAVDGERLRRISPLFHAANITRPLLVLQGANDPRVLQVESDEMVAAARANGAAVEYIVFDDEGHGFRKKENQLRGYGKILEFLDTHLKGETADPAG